LEKVQPDLHASVFVLLVDAKAQNHVNALSKLAQLGDQGKPALPVIFHQIRTCQEQLESRARWDQSTLIAVIVKNMEVLPKIAPEEPQVVKTLIELTKFATRQQVVLQRRSHWATTQFPFRGEAVQLLGEIGEGRTEHRKQIIPPLVTVLKDQVQETKSDNEQQALGAIAAVEQTGEALLKCGPDAKQPLSKEVLPRLKDLQFHKSAEVRKVAEQLRKKIEEVE
jgi:hypothetical protein